MATYYIYSDYLAHHGILGQKWGVRRYQNADGSYTSAGRQRYDIGSKEKGKRSLRGNVIGQLALGPAGALAGNLIAQFGSEETFNKAMNIGRAMIGTSLAVIAGITVPSMIENNKSQIDAGKQFQSEWEQKLKADAENFRKTRLDPLTQKMVEESEARARAKDLERAPRELKAKTELIKGEKQREVWKQERELDELKSKLDFVKSNIKSNEEQLSPQAIKDKTERTINYRAEKLLDDLVSDAHMRDFGRVTREGVKNSDTYKELYNNIVNEEESRGRKRKLDTYNTYTQRRSEYEQKVKDITKQIDDLTNVYNISKSELNKYNTILDELSKDVDVSSDLNRLLNAKKKKNKGE